MLCGSDQINFRRQLYTQGDSLTFETARTILQANIGQILPQNLYFDMSSNPHHETYPSKSIYTASYNKVLKLVTLESHKKQLNFWFGVQSQMKVVKGDTIRAGKAILYVDDIYPVHEQNIRKSLKGSGMTHNKEEICRICFSNEESIENPLLSLCLCSGSVKCMHLDCYRDWYHTKVKFFKGHKITYFQLKNICCQLCKAKIPFKVKHHHRQYTILDYKQNFSQPLANMELMVFPEDNQDQSFLMLSEHEHDSFSYSLPDSLQLYRSGLLNMGDGGPHANLQIDPIPQEQIPPNQQMNEIRLGTEMFEESKLQNNNEVGQYILLRSQKMSQDDEQIIELILIKLGGGYMVTFGNQTGNSNIIIKNGETCKMHMGLNFVDNQIFLSNFSEGLGTFLKMKKNTEYEFIGKEGILIDEEGKQLLSFRQKPWLIKCFQPQHKFRITFVQKPILDLKRNK